MGLSSDFNSVSCDSIPLLLIAAAANWVSYFRDLLLLFLESFGLRFDFDGDEVEMGGTSDGVFFHGLGSGLAGFVLITEQLNKNRAFPYTSSCERSESGCVVCLSKFVDGEEVRRLNCSHVFHKSCLDGWLSQLHMNCPLCRSPLVSEESARAKDRQIAGDLVSWFAVTVA